MDIFDPVLARKISVCGNIAVVTLDDPQLAVPLAQALLDGGVDVMELTLRTKSALDSLSQIVKNMPGMTVGAGTVLTVGQLLAVRDIGAAFAVAPGFNPRIVQAAKDMRLPFAPGVMTPSEIEGAVEMGCKLLKFFPASVVGGFKAMKTLVAPYAHLGLQYIPLGGITPETTAEYLASPLIAACGGSWIAPNELIAAKNWAAITANARQASDIAAAARAAK